MIADQAAFYPDVVAEGSLAGVLQAAADADGVAVPITVSASHPLYHATVTSSVPRRSRLTISAYTWQRRWSIRGEESFQGLELIGGDTDDLAQIVRAAQAWHQGTALTEIRGAAPFVHLSGRFEVPDHDPAPLAQSEWQHLRTRAAEADAPQFQALIEAAYRQPALRALYPFTSMWTLRFSTCTRPGLADLGLFLDAHRGARYTLSTSLVDGEVLGEAATAEGLALIAVRHLPCGLGPVTSGASGAPRG
ncbi:DUF6193 family natural product biosynthesis protein [Streptacidiphilus sp. N1-10]|uniref:DUF6193 family natural product biosynthesis protein n=1 Tax=Streptacidiphilus jeojiensis TaxID=3229225 RepID=A0ABV6XEJ0_9ACTN